MSLLWKSKEAGLQPQGAPTQNTHLEPSLSTLPKKSQARALVAGDEAYFLSSSSAKRDMTWFQQLMKVFICNTPSEASNLLKPRNSNFGGWHSVFDPPELLMLASHLAEVDLFVASAKKIYFSLL